MGNSHSRRNSTGLPKQPIRKPSDSDAKVKVVDDLGMVQTPVDIKDGESAPEPISYPVSIILQLYCVIIKLSNDNCVMVTVASHDV
jgi:hypothetical protein